MKKITTRRSFLSNGIKAGAATFLAGGSASILLQSFTYKENKLKKTLLSTGFDQQPLPYAYTALESIIDAQTMELHYSKHAAAYSKNLKDAATAEGVDFKKPLEEVLHNISKYSAKMRNNGGGHYNHELFWQCMRPMQNNNNPTGKIAEAINTSFQSFTNFKSLFSDAAKNRFGSGWAWLYINSDKKLMIGSSPNQDNPLMDISEIKGFPLLGLDVWEHAYYLKYQNKRAEYIENWWSVVNWNFVEERYLQFLK